MKKFAILLVIASTFYLYEYKTASAMDFKKLPPMAKLEMGMGLQKINLDQRNTLISFFQPDCGHCDRQLQELDCMAENGWRTIAIGVGKNRLPLRRQLLMSSKKSEGLWLTPEKAHQLKVSMTPLNLIWKDSSSLLHLGTITCEKLQNLDLTMELNSGVL